MRFNSPFEGRLSSNFRRPANEARKRNFRGFLARDAVSGWYDQGVDELVGIGVTIMVTADIARFFASS